MLSALVQRNPLVTIYGMCFWSGSTLLWTIFTGDLRRVVEGYGTPVSLGDMLR
jgi:hypothetical protein